MTLFDGFGGEPPDDPPPTKGALNEFVEKHRRASNAAEGVRRREEAIATVAEHAWPEDKRALLSAVLVVAERQDELTSDDVWIEAGVVVDEPRLMGAIMRGAQARGWIVPLDEWRLSERPECHRRPLRVWRAVRS